MNKVKVGIIGLGSLSSFHIDAYRSNPGVEITAFCDVSPERAKQKAKEYGVGEAYTDYREMLEKSGVDAVSVIVPNNSHASVVISALNAGKHVLCEKPPAVNAMEAVGMKEAAERNSRLLMYGFVRRFAQNAQVLKQYIQKGDMGEIYYVKTGYLRRCGNPGGWFTNRDISGGGPLIDIGVHMLDLGMYLMGKPKPVEVLGNTGYKLGGRGNIKGVSNYRAADFSTAANNVEDFANALIRFDNGASLFVETSWALNIKADTLYMDIFGTKSGAKLEPDVEIYSDQNDYMVDIRPVLGDSGFDRQTSFKAEISHFVNCLLNGAECVCPAEDGVTVMKVIDAVYESAKTGKAVELR